MSETFTPPAEMVERVARALCNAVYVPDACCFPKCNGSCESHERKRAIAALTLARQLIGERCAGIADAEMRSHESAAADFEKTPYRDRRDEDDYRRMAQNRRARAATARNIASAIRRDCSIDTQRAAQLSPRGPGNVG